MKTEKPKTKAFLQAFEKEYGHPATYLPAQAGCYDIVQLFADAIRRAGSVDKEAIRGAMAATSDFDFTTDAAGSMSITKLGDTKCFGRRARERCSRHYRRSPRASCAGHSPDRWTVVRRRENLVGSSGSIEFFT